MPAALAEDPAITSLSRPRGSIVMCEYPIDELLVRAYRAAARAVGGKP